MWRHLKPGGCFDDDKDVRVFEIINGSEQVHGSFCGWLPSFTILSIYDNILISHPSEEFSTFTAQFQTIAKKSRNITKPPKAMFLISDHFQTIGNNQFALDHNYHDGTAVDILLRTKFTHQFAFAVKLGKVIFFDGPKDYAPMIEMTSVHRTIVTSGFMAMLTFNTE